MATLATPLCNVILSFILVIWFMIYHLQMAVLAEVTLPPGESLLFPPWTGCAVHVNRSLLLEYWYQANHFFLEWIRSILKSYVIRLEWFRSILEWNHSRVISKIIINVNNFLIKKAREIITSAINSHKHPRILRRGLDIKFHKHLERIRSNMVRFRSIMEWIHSKWNEFIPK